MRVQSSIYLVAIVLASISCKKDELEIPIKSATYDVIVTGMWSAVNHPSDFPSNAHFSPIVGMVHNEKANLFQVGQLASSGIQEMAESGRTDLLNAEIDEKLMGNNVSSRINGTGISNGTSSGTAAIQVSDKHSLVSIVTMVAPSPDWFISVHDLSLLRNGKFINDTTLSMIVYDAGTDSGVSFTSTNEVSSPQDSISVFVSPPLGNGSELKPKLASIRFILRK